MDHQIIVGNLGLQDSRWVGRTKKLGVTKKQIRFFFLGLVVSNLTAPVRVLLLLEDERVAGEVGRCDEVDLHQQQGVKEISTLPLLPLRLT